MDNHQNAQLRRTMTLAVALMLISTLCTAESDTLPINNVKDLQNYISIENPYTSWEVWPGKEKIKRGTRPHEAIHSTYVNTAAMTALQERKKEFPQGSIIVKVDSGGDTNQTVVTVMYKVVGYNPGGGDWYWLKYREGGTVEEEGKVIPCINCHRNRQTHDWVFSQKP